MPVDDAYEVLDMLEVLTGLPQTAVFAYAPPSEVTAVPLQEKQVNYQ